MDNIKTSPLPSNSMDFSQAIRKVIDGEKITRLEWNNKDYGVLRNGILTLYINGEFHSWIISEGDLLAIDWMVVPVN